MINSSGKSNLNGKLVLVVEDNDLNLKLAQSLLQISGAQTIAATDGETSIQLAIEHQPDLILMDIHLPGMDGLQTTQIIKQKSETQHIPIIALTSYAMAGDDQKALDAGCIGYITKPIDTRNFLVTLASFFSQPPASQPPMLNYTPKILIVDDDKLNVKLLTAQLMATAYQTLCAFDGQHGLETALRELPDLILLDITMPKLNGYEVTRKLRQEPSTRDIPIILITALDGPDYKMLGSEAGADEFLNKPVNTPELLARVKSLLNTKLYRDYLYKNIPLLDGRKAMNEIEDLICAVEDSPSILVVTGSDDSSEFARMCLDNQPYLLKSVKDAQSAVQTAQTKKTDLIILDSELRDNGCREVCSRIKDSDPTRNIQILLLTTRPYFEEQLEAPELKVDDFLVKPINGHELRLRVKALLKKKAYLDQIKIDPKGDFLNSITDAPTGLYNLVYLKHFLDRDIKRCRRHSLNLSLVLMNFSGCWSPEDPAPPKKTVDDILKKIGRLIFQNIREVDFCARTGERELMVVFPNTACQGITTPVERIRAKILEKLATPPIGQDAPILSRMSIGIATYPSEADSATELITKAKEALRIFAS